MARLFTSGFELQSLTAGVEFDTSSGGGTKEISTSTKRSGAASLHITAGSFYYLKHQYRSDSATAKVFARFYINIAALPSGGSEDIFYLGNTNVDTGANGLQLTLKTDGTLQLNYWNGSSATNVGSPSSALSTNTWYRIEVTYDDSDANNTITAQIDGSQFATGNGGNLGGNGFFVIGCTSGNSTEIYFDDLAINDTTGSFQTSFPGDGKVILLQPNASGDANTFGTQTGGTAGAGNNYTRVQDNPVPHTSDATDFNGSSTLNQEDLFNVANSGIGASDTVNVVEVGFRFRNSTADATAKIKAEIEKAASGTILQSAAITPNSTTWKTNATAAPKTSPIITYQDPDGSAWTQTTLDSMQIGYKLTTGPGTAGRRIDVTAIWAYVDYTPSAGGTNYTKSFNETITLSETFSKASTRTLSDTTTLSDTIVKAITRTLSDTSVTLSDTFSKVHGYFSSLSDTTTLSDTLSYIQNRFKSFSETITLSDTLIKDIARTFATETITLSDTIVRAITRTITETAITISDFISKAFTRAWDETVTLSEIFVNSYVYIKTYSETITLSDTIEKIFILLRNFTDTITITDMLWRWKKNLNSTFSKITSIASSWSKKSSRSVSSSTPSPASPTWTEKTDTDPDWTRKT